ncbi:hypothetical protein KIN20_013819, partial [Parelaphostrongylus tenuis]
ERDTVRHSLRHLATVIYGSCLMSEQVSQSTTEKLGPSSILGQKSNEFSNIMSMAQLVMRPDMTKQLEQFQEQIGVTSPLLVKPAVPFDGPFAAASLTKANKTTA